MSAMPEHFRASARIDQLRVPPSSIEAEQAVIGGLLLQGKALWKIRDRLSEEDFYRRDHRLIYRAVLDLDQQRKPFDAVTLGAWFEANGLAEQIGGSGYLIELASTTPSAANIQAYAEIVREKAVLRQLIEAGTETVNQAFAPEGRSAADVLADAQSRLGAVLRNEPSELEGTAEVLGEIMDRAAAFLEAGGGFEGLSTGIPDLDNILRGLKPGQLIVVAGRPKMGKTTLARTISDYVALKLGKGVAFHSLEMTPAQLLIASICAEASIDSNQVRCWDLTEGDWTDFNLAAAKLRAAPIRLSRPRNTRVEALIAQTRRAHAEKPLGLVVIDYLQLIHAVGDNRSQAIGDITRALKLMAEELQVAVILLSQLNRELEKRTDKRPTPADLRDSGAIEQDADVVVFIYRDEVYHKRSEDTGTAEVIVALQRNGPTGTARVLSELQYCRFSPLPLDWQPVRVEPEQQQPKPRLPTSARGPKTKAFRTRGQDAAARDNDEARDRRIREVTGGNP